MIGIEPVRVAIWVVPIEKALGRCLRREIGAIPVAESDGWLGCRCQRGYGDGESRDDEAKTANG